MVVFHNIHKAIRTHADSAQGRFSLRKRLGLRNKSPDAAASSESDDDVGSGPVESRRPSDGTLGLHSAISPGFPSPSEPSMLTDRKYSSTSMLSTDMTKSRKSSYAKGPGRDPLGLHLVYKPVTGSIKADIVFIHGLGGTSRMTWSKNKDLTLFWPSMFLPLEQDISNARIFTYGYSAEVMKAGGRTSTSVLDFAKNLLYDLRFSMEDFGNSPIIFVAHSMGGLIVKEAYIQGGNDPQYHAIIKAVTAIVFLSTPHRGSNFAEVLNRILQVSLVSAPKEYINDLAKNSATLQRINETFRHVVKGLNIVSFYETQPTAIGLGANRMMVVEQDSSVLGYPGEVSKGLNADHHSICKYESREDPSYVTVRNYLRTQVSKILPLLKDGSRAASTTSASPVDIRELEKLFSITDPPDTDYITFRDRWTPGTCQWVLSNSAFARWLDDADSDPRLLWFHGGAGCGKSIMTSFIVNHLVESGKSCQYTFIRFGDQNKRSLGSVLRLLAFQIVQVFPAFLHEVSKAASSLKRSADALTIWQRVFKSSLFKLTFPNPLYWVIDGLEESESPRGGIKMFAEILDAKLPLRVLIISRRSPEIEAEFKKIPQDGKWDTVAIDGHLEDHRRFLDKELDEPSEMPGFKENIARRLLDKSQGNFLWLRLTVDRINKCRTIDAVNQALEELPAGMKELYDRMSQSISDQELADRSMTFKILTWVSCATRPLSTAELADALESPSQARSVDELCAGFVTTDNYGNITLIHQTAREYLLGSQDYAQHIDQKTAHRDLFLRCLRCLMTGGLRREISRDSAPSLLTYSATFWSGHLLSSASTSHEVVNPLVKFLRSPNILVWTHAVAKAGQLHVFVQSSNNLSAFAKKLAAVEGNKMPLERRSEELELIDMWATDMRKIVGKFGGQLLHTPDSIYKAIPPFCPPRSMIYKQFGRKEIHSLQVTGFSTTDWDDSLGRLSLSSGQKATGLVAEGPWIVVSADLDNSTTIVVFYAVTFQEARRIEPGERVRRMHVNSIGSLLVTWGLSTAKVWDLATGTCIVQASTPRGRPRPMTMVSSKNDARILIGTDDRRVFSMSLSSPTTKLEEVARIMQKSSGGRSVNSPDCMALSPDGLQLALGYRSSPMTIWDVDFDLVEQVAQQTDLVDVAELLWHPFNGEIFGRLKSGHIFKWHSDWDEPEKIRIHASTLALSSDGTLLAAGNHMGSFKLVITADLTIIHQVVSQDPIVGLAFSTDNQQLYDIRGRYGSVWQPDALVKLSEPASQLSDGGSEAGRTNESLPVEVQYLVVDSISAVAPHPSGTLFLSGTEGGTLYLHSKARGTLQELNEFTNFAIEQIAWSADGRTVCLADLSRTIIVLSIIAGSGGDEIDVKLAMKISMGDLEDSITQIIFHEKENKVLVSSNTLVIILSLEEQNALTRLAMDPPHGRWIAHPTCVDLLVYLTPWTMTFYTWNTLEKTMSILVTPPSQEHFTHSHLSERITPNDELHEHGARKLSSATHQDPHVVIERLILTQTRRYLLVEASTLVDGQRRNMIQLIDIRSLPAHPTGKEHESIDPTIPAIQLPLSLLNRLDRPLVFLSDGMQESLVFTDCHFWICSWSLPSNFSKSPESNEAQITPHYCLPGDWVPGCVPLIRVFDDGTLLCPRNGEVAIVQFSGFPV